MRCLLVGRAPRHCKSPTTSCMKSQTKVTSRQSKNSRIQAGQTSMVPAVAKVLEANGQRDPSRFEAIIERLRDSQAEHDGQLELLGHRDGSLWAERKATAPELRRLKQARDPWGNDWYFGDGSSAYSDAERFHFIIRPDFDGDRPVASEFWEIVTGDQETPDTAYVQAFAEGAMQVWAEVEDQI
jgi:hypothetical protein